MLTVSSWRRGLECSKMGAMTDLDLPAVPEGARSITSYHAHIYWASAAERERALHIRRWIGERFVVQLEGHGQ